MKINIVNNINGQHVQRILCFRATAGRICLHTHNFAVVQRRPVATAATSVPGILPATRSILFHFIIEGAKRTLRKMKTLFWKKNMKLMVFSDLV